MIDSSYLLIELLNNDTNHDNIIDNNTEMKENTKNNLNIVEINKLNGLNKHNKFKEKCFCGDKRYSEWSTEEQSK